MKANKLTINAVKSSAYNCHTKTKILREGHPIAVNRNVKYLGPWIDDNLNFNNHHKFVECEIVYAVGIINKLKCYFPEKILLQLYHVLIYLHHLYAIPIWGSTYKSYSTIFQFSKTKLLKSLPRQNGIPVQTLHIPT